MIWKFLNTGFRDGLFNMNLDEQIARSFVAHDSLPVLRVYGWNPPTISIGFNQNINDFDLDKITDAGIEIVRRPTGGRAIFHSHELTYSIVMESGDKGPRAIYKDINQGLLCGLALLGIEAQLSNQDENFRKLYQSPDSIPCFSSSAKSEIHFNEKKIIGSAQRRFGKIILQHGSFLLGKEHRRLVEFLAPHVIDSKNILAESISEKTIEAETILARSITFEEAADAIKKGFEMEFQITFEDSTLEEITSEITAQ